MLAALQQLGLKSETVTASDPATLADKVDQLYGSIQNPDQGFPIMSPSATGEGSSTADVVIGSMSAWQYALPATHWVSHMPTGMQLVVGRWPDLENEQRNGDGEDAIAERHQPHGVAGHRVALGPA